MPKIRLLTSVEGEVPRDGSPFVRGSIGDELDVDNATARKWCDGVRAERVIERSVPVEKAARV